MNTNPDTSKDLWHRRSGLPIWSVTSFDPYNHIGRDVLHDLNGHRTKQIVAVRIGTNVDEFITIRPLTGH